MLFQHDDARAACRARRVVVGVLLAQKIIAAQNWWYGCRK